MSQAHGPAEGQPSEGQGAQDRGTRARIRDAALRQFAEHGLKGATIRGIAHAAGVSPGLVQHHFPSKDALRQECDRHVLELVRAGKDQMLLGGEVTDPSAIDELYEAVLPVTRYLAMSLVSGTSSAAAWFDAYVAFHQDLFTRGELGPPLPETEDARAVAAVHTAMYLGQVLMFDHLLRALGAREGDPDLVVRIGRARLFLTSDRILGPELRAQIHEGLDKYEQALPAASPQEEPTGDHAKEHDHD